MSIDKTIPYAKLFMVCTCPSYPRHVLPKGFLIRNFREGDASNWAKIIVSAQEIEDEKEALRYFHENYCMDREKLKKRCFFVENDQGEAIATCTAWDCLYGKSYHSLHWFSVSAPYQNKGIGNALLDKVMEYIVEFGETPIYLSTKTNSYSAILMYQKRGFRLISNRFDGAKNNDYQKGMRILKKVLPKETLRTLKKESVKITKNFINEEKI